jgi:hypothetical protein
MINEKQQAKADKCFNIEDNKVAFACLKELVSQDDSECKPKFVLFTQESCTPCAEEKEAHKEDIEKGLITVMDVDTPEGCEVAAKNEIEYFPALVLLDCENKLIYPSE